MHPTKYLIVMLQTLRLTTWFYPSYQKFDNLIYLTLHNFNAPKPRDIKLQKEQHHVVKLERKVEQLAFEVA